MTKRHHPQDSVTSCATAITQMDRCAQGPLVLVASAVEASDLDAPPTASAEASAPGLISKDVTDDLSARCPVAGPVSFSFRPGHGVHRGARTHARRSCNRALAAAANSVGSRRAGLLRAGHVGAGLVHVVRAYEGSGGVAPTTGPGQVLRRSNGLSSASALVVRRWRLRPTCSGDPSDRHAEEAKSAPHQHCVAQMSVALVQGVQRCEFAGHDDHSDRRPEQVVRPGGPRYVEGFPLDGEDDEEHRNDLCACFVEAEFAHGQSVGGGVPPVLGRDGLVRRSGGCGRRTSTVRLAWAVQPCEGLSQLKEMRGVGLSSLALDGVDEGLLRFVVGSHLVTLATEHRVGA